MTVTILYILTYLPAYFVIGDREPIDQTLGVAGDSGLVIDSLSLLHCVFNQGFVLLFLLFF